jgi:uncharacterized protein (DUF1501 family)
MKRRRFLQNISVASAMPFVLNGIPFQLMGGNSALKQMAAACPNDRVLVILQLLGGNDGLNMVIPITDYDKYYNVRANIAIPDKGPRKYITLDTTLKSESQAALHPDMTGLKSMYDDGQLAIVQGISYLNHNQSHFRGRDIIFMGGGNNDYLDSGWVGRYLEDKYSPLQYPKDFPNNDMKDPLALEFGNEVSGIFNQSGNISTSIAINDPTSFFNLVNDLEGFKDKEGTDPRGVPPDVLANSPYGKELNWILSLENKVDQYHDRLVEVYNKGKSLDPKTVTYPTKYPLNAPAKALNNPISSQLQIIANMIHGGCQTKVYLVRMGGFDTHANQVTNSDPTMGNHAALMYHISSAMKAFQDDLKSRTMDDKVLSFTTSEFGRRIKSNGSYGCDHGIGYPVMLFGKYVNPGLIGVNPDLDKDNVEMQYDYRQLYASIMKDWMCVDPTLVDSLSGVYQGDYTGRGQTLPVINNNITSITKNAFISQRFKLGNCYPNPASDQTTLTFFINADVNVLLRIVDLTGKVVRVFLDQRMQTGEHNLTFKVSDIKPGNYLYEINAGPLHDAKQLEITR